MELAPDVEGMREPWSAHPSFRRSIQIEQHIADFGGLGSILQMNSQREVAPSAHLRRIRGESGDNDPWDRPGAFRAAATEGRPAIAESSASMPLIASGVDGLRLVRTSARRACPSFPPASPSYSRRILGYLSLLIIANVSFEYQRVSGGRHIFSG